MKNKGECCSCGHCCLAGPCFYADWDEKIGRCLYLSEPNDFGQMFCKIYDKIVEKEKDCIYPMMGCGCSSTLFNARRQKVIEALETSNG